MQYQSWQHVMDSILAEERINFKRSISKLNPQTPYYVYSLCLPNGDPFYIGKGKNMRAWDHLKEVINRFNPIYSKHITIKNLIDSSEYPIMFIIDKNLDQETAISIEEYYIKFYGRKIDSGILDNIMLSGVYNKPEISRLAGLKGGKTTKRNKLGIYSDKWDRSAQSKYNWESGAMDHIDFSKSGSVGGRVCYEKNAGIFGVDDITKSEWAKKAANALSNSGNRSGIFTPKWRLENSELTKEICSRGGRIGGKIVGKMLWWNNSIINKKSFVSPGDGWVRGMLRSEKKKLQIENSCNSKGNKNNV